MEFNKKEFKRHKKVFKKAQRKAKRPWKGLSVFSASIAVLMAATLGK